MVCLIDFNKGYDFTRKVRQSKKGVKYDYNDDPWQGGRRRYHGGENSGTLREWILGAGGVAEL